ncbi:MAG: EF-P lysine aminoacylase GenX [Proteobacteria bacterium]|nr:EF-P lysine aminoacylase GenX [Pseudomonadota bacterium]
MRASARQTHDLPAGARVTVSGRVVLAEAREFVLRDDTSSLRVAAKNALPAAGCWVTVHGLWNGSVMRAEQIRVVASTARPGTSDGEWNWGQGRVAGSHGNHLEMLKARHRLLRGIRLFFDDQDFVEVETPAIVSSPGLEPHIEAFEVVGGDTTRWLHTSPEFQMKRLLAAGLPRIYQVCRVFRRHEQGHLHQPEFTLLEWYRTFAGSRDVMRDTERLVAALAERLLQSHTIRGHGAPVDVSPPWDRVTLTEAFSRYADANLQSVARDEELFFRLLVEKVEPELGRGRPTFVTHYPASMAALARLDAEDPRFADRFEAYVDGVELCNGYGELVDSVEQRRRFERELKARQARAAAIYPIDERFLAALEEGVPPSGGNALGVDRLLMLILGVRQIEDAVAFGQSRL